MRVLTGITAPDAGTFRFDGEPVDLAAYGPREAHASASASSTRNSRSART